jgi:hypothetical protein
VCAVCLVLTALKISRVHSFRCTVRTLSKQKKCQKVEREMQYVARHERMASARMHINSYGTMQYRTISHNITAHCITSHHTTQQSTHVSTMYVHDVHHCAPPTEGISIHSAQKALRQHFKKLVSILERIKINSKK